jgi:hypothetical protein
VSASTSTTTLSFSSTFQVSFADLSRQTHPHTLILIAGHPGINLFDYLHKLHKSIPVGKQLGISVQVIVVLLLRCAC